MHAIKKTCFFPQNSPPCVGWRKEAAQLLVSAANRITASAVSSQHLVLPFEAPATLCLTEVLCQMCQTEAGTWPYETMPACMADCPGAGMQMEICFATSARWLWCLHSWGRRWPSSTSWIYFCSSEWRIQQPKGHELLENWLQQCSTSVKLVWKLKSKWG